MSARVMRDLGEIAERQWGLVTTRQAHLAGITRLQLSRLASAGVLERVSQGIYRVAGAPSLEHEQILVSWIALDGEAFDASRQPEAVLAGTAAARVHGIGDFMMFSIDYITPRRRVSRRSAVRARVGSLSRAEYTLVDGLPLLTAARTIVDLVEMRLDESLIADALRDGLHSGIVDLARLHEHLVQLAPRLPGAGGDAILNRLLAIAGAGDGR